MDPQMYLNVLEFESLSLYSSRQVAVCNLASIALNRYVMPDKKFDFKKLEQVTGVIVRNLNRVIDVNYYPIPEVRNSVFVHSFLSLFLRPFLPLSPSSSLYLPSYFISIPLSLPHHASLPHLLSLSLYFPPSLLPLPFASLSL